MSKIHPAAAGLAGGLIWGTGMMFISLATLWWGWGDAWTSLLGNIYIGMEASVRGAFVGLVWGFVDLFIAAFLFAHLYNFFSQKLK